MHLRNKSLPLYTPSCVADALEISLHTQEAYYMGLVSPLGLNCSIFHPAVGLPVQRGSEGLRQGKQYLGKVDSQNLPGQGF